MHPADLSIREFSYNLPQDRIAMHPLADRDDSKLLIYKDLSLSESLFSHITDYLPEKSLLVFNDTKVINARIHFQKSSGGKIEIFCLEPTDHNFNLNITGKASWNCLVGGASRWKEGILQKEIELNGQKLILQAVNSGKNGNAYQIDFSWNPATFSFADVINAAGLTPLPPYIKRNAAPEDVIRYQTIYANQPGSVAAPTAGLHFTKDILNKLPQKNISTAFVTLNVSSGTFKPVDADRMEGHQMHAEWIEVREDSIKQLIQQENMVIAVGTTSARTLETLYWLGIKTLLNPEIDELKILQWDVYNNPLSSINIDKNSALKALLQWMNHKGLKKILASTELMIAPSYKFRICNALITNFHQPRSTLLLLVAAAIGADWKKIYEYAMENNFRFLSYGDSSLLFIS